MGLEVWKKIAKFILSFLFEGSNDGTCCSSKIVGNHRYTLLERMDTTNYGCHDSCVYEREDWQGSKFCFRPGDLSPICQGLEIEKFDLS